MVDADDDGVQSGSAPIARRTGTWDARRAAFIRGTRRGDATPRSTMGGHDRYALFSKTSAAPTK
jgi:hypothetical protein